MTDRVFVYGTLRRGKPFHAVIAPFVVSAENAQMAGLLVDLGAYPGWIAGEGTVHGEVFRLYPLPEALRRLDEFESYFGPVDPRSLYERVETEVRTPARRLTAWAYRYRRPTAGRPIVPGGVWVGPGEERRGK